MSLANEIFKKERQEFLNEASIDWDIKQRIHVGVSIDPDRGFGDIYAYFKVAKHGHFTNEQELCRLSFRQPVYIDHNNDVPNKWCLNSKEKKILMSILRKQYRHDKSITVWQELINQFNNWVMASGAKDKQKYLLDINMPITDYTKLPERK